MECWTIQASDCLDSYQLPLPPCSLGRSEVLKMCFDTSDRPLHTSDDHLASSERVSVQADDGTEVAARLATTRDGSAPGVVLLPDVRGLHPYYEDLAGRFADAGVHAIAIDHFSRSAGTGYRDADFDNGPHHQRGHDEHSRMDVRAAARRAAKSRGDVRLRPRVLQGVAARRSCRHPRTASPGWSDSTVADPRGRGRSRSMTPVAG